MMRGIAISRRLTLLFRQMRPLGPCQEFDIPQVLRRALPLCQELESYWSRYWVLMGQNDLGGVGLMR